MSEKTAPTISVVIPTFNGSRYIPDCLNSLEQQLRKPEEIILVDDGSTDDTASLVASSYPKVRLIELGSNRGFAAAANEGIRHAGGDYVALLNNDTRATAQWLSELERALDENPSVGSCSSKMLFADRPDVINSIGIGFTCAGTAFDVGYGKRDGDRYDRPRPIFGACAGAAMYKRKLFDEVGLFDEDLFMWYEDADLSFRAQLAGYKCRYVPTAVVYHVGGGTASPANKSHIYYCSRNQILVLAKNLPDSLRYRYFGRLIPACLKHSIKTLLSGETTVTRGYLAALKELKYFVKKNRITAYRTRVSVGEILCSLEMDSIS
ncbi:glycosyltransferase family 2 protein [Candidatus Poribacteria bacterium]|nr:glycosyltransferase family 2 protein [Candidatus Poribacteria bacterium]